MNKLMVGLMLLAALAAIGATAIGTVAHQALAGNGHQAGQDGCAADLQHRGTHSNNANPNPEDQAFANSNGKCDNN